LASFGPRDYIGARVIDKGAIAMARETTPQKEGKKKPLLTPKEKKALKRAKKEARKA
jgi:hypothetical protein